MRQNPQFAQEVQDLANEINKELEDEGQGKNVMNVYGGKAYQQNQNKGMSNMYNQGERFLSGIRLFEHVKAELS